MSAFSIGTSGLDSVSRLQDSAVPDYRTCNLEHQLARKAENESTFDLDPKRWTIMTEIEQFVQAGADATLQKIASAFVCIAQHNVYQIAEVVTSRKKQAFWNAENGIK